jgi:predicted negative regulator of RcsB-dependent stress response
MIRFGRRLAPCAVAMSLLLTLASGCGDAGSDSGARAWIERAATESAAAESARERGEVDQAIARLTTIVDSEVPTGVAEEDARVVRQDAYDRLARLVLERGDPARALTLSNRGLALGERDDVFTASLLTTRGRIHEAAGRDREAARDYHRALEINEALLDRALAGE